MTEIDPAQIPDLLLPSMNTDHAREMRLVNDVAAAVAAHRRGEGSVDLIVERLSLLAVHSREHFLREETLMREARFPAYPAHKAEHDRVLAEMNAEARAFRQQGDAARLSRYLQEALPGWYLDHTRSLDVAAARFLAGRPG
jgi:hemerythrin